MIVGIILGIVVGFIVGAIGFTVGIISGTIDYEIKKIINNSEYMNKIMFLWGKNVL